MTQEELKEKYEQLYEQMSVSNEPKQMKLFGSVMNDMMSWAIKNQPQAAESWIDKLCAIKWEQFLTKAEATKIVAKMQPEAPWDFDTWSKAMAQLGLEAERKSVFNQYALWAWMNAKYSDEGEVYAKLVFGQPLEDVPADKIVPLIHALAVSNLCDEDHRFDIRAYFGCD